MEKANCLGMSKSISVSKSLHHKHEYGRINSRVEKACTAKFLRNGELSDIEGTPGENSYLGCNLPESSITSLLSVELTPR